MMTKRRIVRCISTLWLNDEVVESMADGQMFTGGTASGFLEPGERYMTKSCDYGYPNGCKNMAVMHDTGIVGLTKDLKKANSLFEKACAMGHAEACRVVGVRAKLGTDGVAKDLTRARVFLDKACKAGEKAACDHLSKMEPAAGKPPAPKPATP